jgi:hypothetical protein
MRKAPDKRNDFIHAYEVAAREATEAGHADEAAILKSRANDLRAHVSAYPNLAFQPQR